MSSTSQKRSKTNQPVKEPVTSTAGSRTPYIHWIHCNICFEQYMHKRRTFYLLACEHVSCQQCIVEIPQTAVNGPTIYKCPLCHQQTRACKMGNDMPSHLKELFHPEPYLDGLHNKRIMLFQEKHRRRFLDYADRQYLITQELKEETRIEREKAKKLYQDLQEAKTERKHLEKRVIAIKKQRKEMEDKRSSISNSSSSSGRPQTAMVPGSLSTSHSSASQQGPRMPRPTVTSSTVTSFSHQSNNNSFLL